MSFSNFSAAPERVGLVHMGLRITLKKKKHDRKMRKINRMYGLVVW